MFIACGVFVRNRMAFETREVSLGEKTKVRYRVHGPRGGVPQIFGAQLMTAGGGVKSVVLGTSKGLEAIS